MAATIKGITSLSFGCDTISTVVMQSSDASISRDIVYAQKEDGDYAAFAIIGAGKCEASGEYLHKGSDISSLATLLSTLSSTPTGSGGLYIYELSVKTTNNGFKRGSFKAGGVEGVS